MIIEARVRSAVIALRPVPVSPADLQISGLAFGLARCGCMLLENTANLFQYR